MNEENVLRVQGQNWFLGKSLDKEGACVSA
jgi:hypothetical protein